MAEIIIAKTAGFCFGVKRAVDMAEKAAAQYGNCKCLGPLTHNEDVVKKLESLGIVTVESTDEVNHGDNIIIRSHGAKKEELESLFEKSCNIIDATCPYVAKIHRYIENTNKTGGTVLIFGERNHPEIKAAASLCKRTFVFENESELAEILENNPELREKQVTVASQTTAEREKFEININLIEKQCTNAKIFDTICNTTIERQHEARELASECDAMVVIGGRHSANSRRLADICREHNKAVFFIQNADELDTEPLRCCNKIGITAGASTPEWIIKEVNRKMSEEIKTVDNTVGANESESLNTTVEAPKAAAPEEAPEMEKSFEELLESTIVTLHTGEKVKGIVAAISQTEVSVDLEAKQSGYIQLSELSDDPSANVNDIVKVGDEIEAYVMRVNDVDGTVMLSKKRLDSAKAWENMTEARNSRAVVEGTVIEENKGGVVVMVKGIRVFVPASQSGLPKDTPMTELVKQKVRLRITEVNQPHHRVVGSIRAVQYEERKAKAEAIWNEIEVGKRYHGVVKSLTSYGAFVDIGGIDGMVHVSELSWRRIHQPSEVVSVGDELDVYVISFDRENKKISLGYKDPNDNPWVKFMNNYKVGDTAEVKVVKLMTFGAFAEILPGVDGLIHISQITDRRIGKPGDVLSEGDIVKVKIINIDEENKKISLSIRALMQGGEAPVRRTEREPKPEPVEEPQENKVVYDTDHPPVTE